MIESPAPPHRLVVDRPGVVALAVAASLLLSLWALYLDPVINSDGISNLRAAYHFHAGEWRAGMAAGGTAVYAMLVAALMHLTGISAVYGAYALSAGLIALLVVGFMVLVAELGGGRSAWLMAAPLVLLFPTLNELRSCIIGDAGYWACYVWSVAYFLHYAAASNRPSLGAWAAATLAASLFAVEALVFLIFVPLWRYAHDAGRYRGILKAAAFTAGGAVILAYLLWEQAWHAEAAGRLLHHPVAALTESWQALARTWGFKVAGLRDQFLNQFSRGYAAAALLATLLVLSAAGLVKALGLVYTVIAGYALAATGRIVPAEQRRWWGSYAVLAISVLLVPALAALRVDARDAMTASLTILAVVPAALERLWQARGDERGYRRWILPALVVLVLGAGLHGLDLRTSQYHLREAGLWLRANAAPGSDLYSNSRIVVYYSGLEEHAPAADYSWREAMNTVQRGKWRDYDYLALEITRPNSHREGILMRNIDTEPVATFSNEQGDRVLIFDTRR